MPENFNKKVLLCEQLWIDFNKAFTHYFSFF